MKPFVFVTREIPKPGLDILREHCQVELGPDRQLSRDELAEAVRGKSGLLSMLSDPVDSQVLGSSADLKVVANYAVGFNNIDLVSATQKGIAVTNTPGVLTETTADLAWALLMSAARRVVESDAFTRSGRFRGWEPMLFLGYDIYGKTLGLIGLGRIGQAVARRAQGFGMRILYYTAHRRPVDEEKRLGIEYASLDDLLAKSDFVSLHVPLTDSTRRMIGRRELGLMKRTAVIVNTARGPVVDEAALVDALREGRLAAAGFDVYENEPALAPGLAELSNVTLLPHTGSGTLETRTNMAVMAAQSIVDAIAGKRPEHVVNPEVYQ